MNSITIHGFFDKKELKMLTIPLKKNNSDLKSLGDVYTFIKIGSKLKYKVSKLLHKDVELMSIPCRLLSYFASIKLGK